MVIHLKLMKLAARYRSSGLLFLFFDKPPHHTILVFATSAEWNGRTTRERRTHVHKTPNWVIVVDRIIVCSKSEKIYYDFCLLTSFRPIFAIFSHFFDFSGESPTHKALALIRFHADRLLFSSLASPVEQLVSTVVGRAIIYELILRFLLWYHLVYTALNPEQ